MSLAIAPNPLPLAADAESVVRVGGTRVTLDTVVTVFQQGVTPEEITCRFPSLRLTDVYSTIAFYLNNREAIEAYLQQRQQQAEAISEGAS